MILRRLLPCCQALTFVFCLSAALSGNAQTAPARPVPAADRDAEGVDRATAEANVAVPDTLTLRARVMRVMPEGPTTLKWRHGGEGLGGDVISGELTPEGPDDAPNGAPFAVGQWSKPVSLNSLYGGRKSPRRMFLTFMVGLPSQGGRKGAAGAAAPAGPKSIELEFEFAWNGRAIKTLHEHGPDGGTVGLVIQAELLGGGRRPDSPEFANGIMGVLEYALRRADTLEKLPWNAWPTPREYVIITDMGGYGAGTGYAIRHSDPAVTLAECRTLRCLGVNAMRGGWQTIDQFVADGMLKGMSFDACETTSMGYPVDSFRKDRPGTVNAAMGCPFNPAAEEATRTGVAKSLEVLKLDKREVWALTVDEIGSVFDRAPEGKSHMAKCPLCAEGYRQFLQQQAGLTPSDFGQTAWADVRPMDVFSKDSKPDLANPADAMNAYYMRQFNNYASARLFATLRGAFASTNEAKRAALTAGDLGSPVARQPWVYAFALRGNNYLLGGHSLDFYDFYRLADNAFVYETSNRDPRIWNWDSHLLDVGRVVAADQGLAQGVYIKPHRGAPVQRALSAVARGNRMLYWYTYGPDYVKGDTFSASSPALELTSKAAHLIGKTEVITYGSTWAEPARVAIVKPRSMEVWMGPGYGFAAWENAKWCYTALTHAHLQVDPIDEVMIATKDLSKYRIVYYLGTHVTRAAAARLARYVEEGGTLYTCGYGLARDQANQPLNSLLPVLGLEKRDVPQMWYNVKTYGAGALPGLMDASQVIATPPETAVITAAKVFRGRLNPLIGRETLHPIAGSEVLAAFGDGSPAAVRHRYGKGTVYVVGFFPGLEYAAPLTAAGHDYDMTKDFSADTRSFIAAPALERVSPVVTSGAPAVEGVLVRNPKSGARAVILMNWAYRMTSLTPPPGSTVKPRASVSLVPASNLEVSLRVQGVTKARSAMLERDMTVRVSGDRLMFTLPQLDEGDVITLQ